MTAALADVGMQNLLTVGAIVVGSVVAFFVIRRIVKLVLSLVIAALVAAAALLYCVHAGYISRETAERINPMKREQVVEAARSVGSWAGGKVKDAARRAVSAAVNEAIGQSLPTNGQSR